MEKELRVNNEIVYEEFGEHLEPNKYGELMWFLRFYAAVRNASIKRLKRELEDEILTIKLGSGTAVLLDFNEVVDITLQEMLVAVVSRNYFKGISLDTFEKYFRYEEPDNFNIEEMM